MLHSITGNFKSLIGISLEVTLSNILHYYVYIFIVAVVCEAATIYLSELFRYIYIYIYIFVITRVRGEAKDEW